MWKNYQSASIRRGYNPSVNRDSDSALRLGDIPDEFFTAVAFLIPYLNRVAQNECEIDIGSLLVMMHLSIAGEVLPPRGRTMLRRDLTTLLLERGFTPPGVTRLLQSLEAAGLIQRGLVSPDVRQEIFEPSDRVNTLSISLTPEGEHKIEEFKAALRTHFGHWLESESKRYSGLSKWIRRLLPRGVEMAQSIIQQMVKRNL